MSYNPFTLEGKTILVTGASSGIGKAVAEECGKLGASVIISARNRVRLEQTCDSLGDRCRSSFVADITDESAVTHLVGMLPKVDGVVLCAGIGKTIPVKFATRKTMASLFETNFFAQVELIRLLLKAKKINDSASIVAISSIGGPYSIEPGNGPYGATKAALLTWTKFLAQELSGKKIRVNCICPGMVHTPLVDTPGVFSREDLETYEASIPLHRFGEAQEIAYACIYFLSDASKWVTGTDLIIDGGKTFR